MYKGENLSRSKPVEENKLERPLKTYKEYLEEANKLNKKYGSLSATIKTKEVS